ncbi:MAG TPA: SLBB domain-containing protein, partial [Chthoniobacterales bacterium]|nr:SLBB domain-containing protein [Chthoniobacterales bacterium]
SLEKRSVRSPGRVYVTGEVVKQGPLDLPADEKLTVSRAIIQAGGFADFANKRKVKLIRKTEKGETVAIVDVAEIINKGRLDQDQLLQAGDVILVPARLINW